MDAWTSNVARADNPGSCRLAHWSVLLFVSVSSPASVRSNEFASASCIAEDCVGAIDGTSVSDSEEAPTSRVDDMEFTSWLGPGNWKAGIADRLTPGLTVVALEVDGDQRDRRECMTCLTLPIPYCFE
jgi:hypothetical protein